MPLTIGTQLGSHEITALLGKGGMGEVYRARDTKLKREVAIKILPDEFSRDPERLARFQREAEVLALLNHPNIAAIYDLDEANGSRFLVLELVEGESLADRIRRGPIPIDESLNIANAICEALEAAHEKGIIHRDLKPANIKLTPEGKVKVLDFGLAKVREAEAATVFSNSPTLLTAGSVPGIILGTAAYMSPEQAKGKETDRTTDIWAFGCLVFEMLTGKPAFEGEAVAEILGAVLKDEPRWNALPMETPAGIRRLLRRCLQKNRIRRLHDVADARLEIEEAKSEAEPIAPAIPSTNRREWVAWALFTLSTIVALLVVTVRYFRSSSAPQPIQFLVSTPDSERNQLHVSISPDGQWIAFVGGASSTNDMIFVRQIDSVAVRPVAGTEGGLDPFWSFDSRYIGFWAGGKLKKVQVSGGATEIVSSVPSTGPGGATWNQDNVIIFSSRNALYRVSAAGGDAVAITKLDESQKEDAHLWPYFLPDGQHFLYWVRSPQSSVYLGSLNSMERKRLFASETRAAYAEPGFLIFQRQGILFAQPFDPTKASLQSEPSRIAEDIGRSNENTGRAAFAVSRTGTLITRQNAGLGVRRFVWFERSGKQLGSVGEATSYGLYFDLSPDEKQLAVDKIDPTTNNGDIWLMDLTRGGVMTRFTSDPAPDTDVVWSPDGSLIAFSSDRKGEPDIFEKKSSGIGPESSLLAESTESWVKSWSKDGRYIAYENRSQIRILPLFGDRTSIPFVESPYEKHQPHFSFDTKWLAYSSAESGAFQIYVASFPAGEQKRLISTNGGVEPRWRKDGKELYYLSLDGKLMAVDMTLGSKIESGNPRMLFDTGITAPSAINEHYAVTSDGQRFLVQLPVDTSAPPIHVITNWTALLNK